MLRGRLVALEGPSGIGKSTTARLLHERQGWGMLAEAFDRLQPPPSLEFGSVAELVAIEERLLDEECRRFREARGRCRRGEDVVADTGFLGPLTYTAGLVALGRSPPSALSTVRAAVEARLARGELGGPDGTIYLELTPSELRRRSSTDPHGLPEALAARHRAVARFERRSYFEALARRWPGRVVILPASADPPTLAQRAGAIAAGFPRREPTREGLTGIVDLVVACARSSADRAVRSSAILKKDPRSHGASRR